MSKKSSLLKRALLFCLLVFPTAGCSLTPSQKPNKLYDVKWHPVESLFESILGDSEQDRLWKEGYGFNNPNAERNRQGKQK